MYLNIVFSGMVFMDIKQTSIPATRTSLLLGLACIKAKALASRWHFIF